MSESGWKALKQMVSDNFVMQYCIIWTSLEDLRLVHSTPEKLENAALGLLSTLIRDENGAFRKRSSNRRNLKTPAVRFSVEEKHFENGAFRKRWHRDNSLISLTEIFAIKNPRWPVIVSFLNSTGVVWTENIWCVFRVKPPFSNSSGVV